MVACAAVALGIAVAPPLYAVASELLTATHAFHLLGSARLWWLLLRSLLLAGAVTSLCLVVGVPLGVLFARAALPLRRLLFGVHLSVALLPPFLPALGWFHVFGTAGWLGDAVTARVLFSDAGAVLVLAECFIPIMSALTALGVSSVDTSLEEAGRITASPLRTAALVLVPCAAPSISLAAVVIFALAVSELGVPMFLRVDVYPAVVFARLGGMDFAPGEAAVFVLPLLLVAAALLVIERRFAGRRALAALRASRAARSPLFAPNALLVVPALLGALLSVAPLVALASVAVTRGGLAELPRWLGTAPLNGLRAGTIAAVLMTLVAVVLGRELGRHTRSGLWLDAVATLAFLLPSSIVGVGLTLVWSRSSAVYGSFAILVLGFVARYAALATRTFASAVAQVPASLDDAARTVGASYVQRLALLAGTAARGLGGAFVIALLSSLRDLETAALYYPPGGEPLTVRIFTLEANGPAGVVAALAVLHVGITLAAAGAGWLLSSSVRRA